MSCHFSSSYFHTFFYSIRFNDIFVVSNISLLLFPFTRLIYDLIRFPSLVLHSTRMISRARSRHVIERNTSLYSLGRIEIVQNVEIQFHDTTLVHIAIQISRRPSFPHFSLHLFYKSLASFSHFSKIYFSRFSVLHTEVSTCMGNIIY